MWHTLATLPAALASTLSRLGNLPPFLRSELAGAHCPAFGYHVGSVAATEGQPFVLAPSADKGYSYGVFFSLDAPAIQFAGGKRYRRKPDHLFVYVVPVDGLCHSRYSPHGELVGCTNGRAVVFTNIQQRTLSFEEAVPMLSIDPVALNTVLSRYQRQAKDVRLYWCADEGYCLVPMEADRAREARSGKSGEEDMARLLQSCRDG